MAIELQDPSSGRFLNFLKQEGLLSASAEKRARLATSQMDLTAERIVVELGLLSELDTFRALSKHLDLPFYQLDEIDQSLLKSSQLDVAFLERVGVVPVSENSDGMVIGVTSADHKDLLMTIGYDLGVDVTSALVTPSTVASVLDRARGVSVEGHENVGLNDIARLQELANDGPTITFVNETIARAVVRGASDVHLEANSSGGRIRFRVDGALEHDRDIPDDLRISAVSRLKIMANLNISEKRRPQDGRAELVVRGNKVDIRLSTLPTQFGESVVLRLLDRARVKLDWQSLRMDPAIAEQIQNIVAQPNGIFLVAGPTGSGKTTTLYTALQGINTDDRKIITVEDPIEYAMEGVNQVQIDPAIDLGFSTALRAILRQDPNIVLVGEIRDEETAEIAVRAALMGRLVLSTIHTNDSIGAIDRLLDLKIPPYLIGATLRAVLSQRLIRANCDGCSGKGCEECGQTGLNGRMALCEMLKLSEELKEKIIAGDRGGELRRSAAANGFVDLKASGSAMIGQKLVSELEVIRAIGSI